ncbi:MAG: A/G-specific adenine glycosylase [Phycisphaerae bacterium]
MPQPSPDIPDPSPGRLRRVRNALVTWYAEHQRDLPWRRTHDPYAVWVSEIMLQQTRVATVIPYFNRWMQRFPTVADLAEAPPNDVLKHWEGLGYYTRARNLHAAAGQVCDRYDSRLPREPADLRTLPGIGRYTAGAIASIAFGLDEPVLDGNVVRVLCRVFAIDADPARATTREALWKIARRLIPVGRAGELNQAMMDLGATVCVPREPLCPRCPLRRLCDARRQHRTHQLPRKTPSRQTPHYEIAAAVVYKDDRVLIARRRPEGLLGGLWEFPGGKREAGETLTDTARRETREETGIDIEVGGEITVVKHAYSHFRITLHAFRARWLAGEPQALQCDAVRWVRPADLNRYAFPAANQKILQALADDA